MIAGPIALSDALAAGVSQPWFETDPCTALRGGQEIRMLLLCSRNLSKSIQ
jgi:hypothetical protein